MKLYQVSFYAENGQSFGYEYFPKSYLAIRRRNEWLDENNVDDSARAEVCKIEIEYSKGGIVDALNKYGRHPDNG